RDLSLLAEHSDDMAALFATSDAHLLDPVSGCESLCFDHVAAPLMLFNIFLSTRYPGKPGFLTYLARGRNERTELLRPRANRANVLVVAAAIAGAPPKAGKTTRFTACPVNRSIARID